MIELEEAIAQLLAPDLARLKFCFEQGDAAYVTVKRFENLYVGVHMDQLEHFEVVSAKGKWALARKKVA